ncbi:MAG TPA: NAD(P)-dependent oxidoreductase [Microvirga sp.]|nr:NAD(P)-dependent oxidoreductase [Microvirga sp.]
MRAIVTGGLGFLGAATARALAARGHDVLATDTREGRLPGIATGVFDVADPDAVRRTFEGFRPEAVVHLAALLTPESRADIVAATRVNALGTAIVFAAARDAGVRRVVYASSVAALGNADPASGDATVPAPASVYGATKAFCEHLAGALAGEGGPTMVGLRFGWIYGPGRDRGWREIQDVIEAAARGDALIPYPDYPDPIDWTWVDDAAEVAARAVEAPLDGTRVFNVAGDKRRVREAVAHLSNRFPGCRFEPRPAPAQPASWAFANDGLQGWLGHGPKTPMETGLDRLLAAVPRR